MSTANILEGLAVARRTADEAGVIFGAYAATKGLQMAQTYSAPAPEAPVNAPAAPGMSPGGQGSAPAQAQGGKPSPVIAEHEVFKNDKNAVAFFFYHSSVLDKNAEEGPFWFTIQDGTRIVAGTSEAYNVFEGLNPDVVAMAKQRGVIMLVEFENQQPFRCTPCYLSDSF